MARRLPSVFLLVAVLMPSSVAALADTYPRQTGIDVLEYVFRLVLSDETDRIEASTTVDLRLVDDEVAELALDLVGPSGDTGMTVGGVRVGNEPAAFEHSNDRVRIALPAGLTAGDRISVTVDYAGVAATGLRIGPNRHGDRTFFSDNWPNRARHWLATVDHPYDKARSRMIVTAPSRYQVVSNGLLVEQTDLGDGRRLTHWYNSVPIATWLNAVGVAEFAVQHLEPFDGKPVQTWVYPQDRDTGFDVFDDPTHDVLEYYSNHVGPYAYEKMAQVQAASVGGGMESASAPFYGEDSAVSGGVRWRNVIIHEIAHQWFGNAVTESDWDDVWLSEGFATYFTSLFIEHQYGREAFVQQMRGARDRVLAFYADRPDYRIVHDDLDDMSQVTTGMQYQKGSWVLHMLRVLVGDEAYWQGIRTYYAEHFNGHATTADFRRAMENASGLELQWFFDQWLRRGGVPELEVEMGGQGRSPIVTVRQRQPGPPFRLQVPLRLHLGGGEVRETVLEMDGESATWEVGVLPAAATWVEIDPDTELLWRPPTTAGGERP